MNDRFYLSAPRLRFKGFSDDWQEEKLGDIAFFTKGKNISKDDIVEDGVTECIRYGELYTTYNEVIDVIKSKTNLEPKELIFSKYNDVVIPASGETNIDIATASCVQKDGVALGGDLNIIKSNQNGIFLSYYLNNTKRRAVARLGQGNSVVHLYPSQLKKLSLNLPSLVEQEKIADFLTTVDENISKLKEKKAGFEKYKKGVMQAIFSQKVRYKKTDGTNYSDWEEKKLGELLDYEQPTKYIVDSTEYSNNHKTPVLTAGKTFILGYTDEQNNIFGNLPVIIFDDFTTASQFVTFPFKVKSSAMKILSAKKNENVRFIFEAMQQIEYEVGGHGRHWISVFSNTGISTPSADEQEKIAEFLTSLDNKSELMYKELEGAKKFKKALLQQMFV